MMVAWANANALNKRAKDRFDSYFFISNVTFERKKEREKQMKIQEKAKTPQQNRRKIVIIHIVYV